MISLMQKIDAIAVETGEGTSTKASAKGGDEFKRLKAKISVNVKEIRTNLKSRDELLSKSQQGTKAQVQMSHTIRKQLQEAREDANKLLTLQRKEATKAKGKPNEQVEERQEVVELVFKHLEELDVLEKKRFTAKDSEARVELFSAGGRGALGGGVTLTCGALVSSSGAGSSSRQKNYGTELPDIDNETREGLQLLEMKNAQIDQQLDVVAEGVKDLKSIALTMRDEVKVQGAMVDEITNKVDSAQSHLNTINKKMKKTLASTRSADRFILDFILLVVLLAIIGYIISMVT